MRHCSGIYGKQCTCGKWHGADSNQGLFTSRTATLIAIFICALLWALSMSF